MKPVALLLLIACFQRSISGYCQTTSNKVTLSEKNVPLEKILKAIRTQTTITYFGDASWPQLAQKVTISVKDVPVLEALDICFRNQPLYYEMIDGAISIHIKLTKDYLLKGVIRNEKQEPVPNATILSRGKGKPSSAISDEQGGFSIQLTRQDTMLLFSSISYEPKEVRFSGEKEISVQMKARIIELTGAVVAHNGYQEVPKERATGSYSHVSGPVIDRRVSTSILDRLDGVTSSLIFNKNVVPGTNQSVITIRGRSTINGNPEPLVVVDNFPYSGNMNNINPEDIETITVLKDAAAASIWGAFSGNGVVVMTTKKGKYDAPKRWNFTTSVTAGERPDLYYQPILSSRDYIEVEQFLFKNNFYQAKENSLAHPALSPAVEIMIRRRDGLISAEDSAAQMNALAGTDTRRDLNKYFYRTSLNQLYALNFSGGNARDHYFFSAGYNKDISSLVRNQYGRVTLDASNTWRVVPGKLEVGTDVAFTRSWTGNNNNGVLNSSYPYTRLKDVNGGAAAVPLGLRQTYVDTVGGGQLLDWHFRPLDELNNADNTTRLSDVRANLNIRYVISRGLEAHLLYQFQHGTQEDRNYQSLRSYTTRDLINSYTQVDENTGQLSFPVPRGGIMDKIGNRYSAHNARLQLDYAHLFGEDHQLNALGGIEMRDVEGHVDYTRLYGYDPATGNGQSVNYDEIYLLYYSPVNAAKIPFQDRHYGTSDRFLSYYANASYAYRRRYIVSASARRDESNLFGVKANQKGVPLWSAGLAWEVCREGFYNADWLPMLKLRITKGANGNVDRTVSAFTTAQFNGYTNDYAAVFGTIVNPPNPNLKWERVDIFNVGLDFASKSDRIGGSLDFYTKSGKDLIGQTLMDPTTGVTSFTGNAADMTAHGFDLTLRTRNLVGRFKWTSDWLMSYIRDKVTRYGATQPSAVPYLSSNTVNPLVGRPLYSLYALRWMGLDPNTGDPLGMYMGHADTTYSRFITYPTDSLIYKGPMNPPFFGSWRNTFQYKQWELSANIVFKLGYNFRRNSILYYGLYAGISKGHNDFNRRWQVPGDERSTNVPSMTFPGNNSRDEFYRDAEVLIEKADQIRLQDIRISYDLRKSAFAKIPVQAIKFYIYANNIGIIWKANHKGIDPDVIDGMPIPRSLALGCKLEF